MKSLTVSRIRYLFRELTMNLFGEFSEFFAIPAVSREWIVKTLGESALKGLPGSDPRRPAAEDYLPGLGRVQITSKHQ